LSTSFLRFQFQQQTTHPLFQKKLWSGGRAGGKGWLKSVVVRRGGRLRRPAAAAFRLPPPFFSLSRARATCSRFFLAGNLLDAVRRWRSCADAVRKKMKGACLCLLGVVYFNASGKTKKI